MCSGRQISKNAHILPILPFFTAVSDKGKNMVLYKARPMLGLPRKIYFFC